MADCQRYVPEWPFFIPSRAAIFVLKTSMSMTSELDDVPRSSARDRTEFIDVRERVQVRDGIP